MNVINFLSAAFTFISLIKELKKQKNEAEFQRLRFELYDIIDRIENEKQKEKFIDLARKLNRL